MKKSVFLFLLLLPLTLLAQPRRFDINQMLHCDSVELLDITQPTIHRVHSGYFMLYELFPGGTQISNLEYHANAWQRWLRFRVPADTTLVFTITPLDGKTDFDFALFETEADSDCAVFRNVMPVPVRVCNAAPYTDSVTGMSWRAASVFEGAGNTNPYLRPVRVYRSKYYYLLVQADTYALNRGVVSDSRFRIEFFNNGQAPHITLRNVYFETGKADLKPVSSKSLDSMFVQLKQKNFPQITIVGHTDNAGKDSANLVLSRQRAEAVKQYFIRKNYPAAAVSSEGRGSRYPVADNESEQGRSLNRRVEIEFKK